MKNLIKIILCCQFLCIPIWFSAGCKEKSVPEVNAPPSEGVHPSVLRNSTLVSNPSGKENPLSIAHKSYQESYENYVRLLRESGPQTMETLHALSDYQRKYRIYQMLLDAEKGDVVPGQD